MATLEDVSIVDLPVTHEWTLLQLQWFYSQLIEFFTISPQYKIANIDNAILAAPFKTEKTNKVYNLLPIDI